MEKMFHWLAAYDKVAAIVVSLTVLIGAIFITPLCGLLFQCHCDWPWLRFYFDCNYFQPEVTHKCPWCTSDLAGLGSIGMALILAMLASLFSKPDTFATKAIISRVMFGLTIFILIATISGALAAYSQDYPHGIGRLFTNKGTDE